MFKKAVVSLMIFSWINFDIRFLRLISERGRFLNNIYLIIFDIIACIYSCMIPLGAHIEIHSLKQTRKFNFKAIYLKIVYKIILLENNFDMLKAYIMANLILFILSLMFKLYFSEEVMIVLEKFDNFKIEEKEEAFSSFLIGYIGLTSFFCL